MSRRMIRSAPLLSRTFVLALAGVAASVSLGLSAAMAADGSQPAAAAAAMPAAGAGGLHFQVIEGSGGVPLNVVTAGDKSKPPILLVHGIGQSYVSWENQLKPPVTDQFYVVAFDLRGHGNSGKPWGKENYADYRKYAEDVQAVIKGTGIDRPLLVGWSYGTLVVADYLRVYGASGLRGIELVGAFGGFTPPPAPAPAAMAAQMAKTREMQLSGNLEDNIAAARGGIRFLTAHEMTPAYWERAVQLSLMLPAYARRYMFERSTANQDLIPKITVPLMLNVGSKDVSTPEAQGREFAAKVPGTKVSVYPESGHSPFAEEPERFNRELIEFAKAVLK